MQTVSIISAMKERTTVISEVFPPEVDLYRGRWIAIRDHKIIADAATADELSNDSRVIVGRDILGYARPLPRKPS